MTGMIDEAIVDSPSVHTDTGWRLAQYLGGMIEALADPGHDAIDIPYQVTVPLDDLVANAKQL